MVIFEDNTKYTTKSPGGCWPYFALADLCNKGNIFKRTDERTSIEIDIYIPHFTYMKTTGNFIVEMSTMHRNPNSDFWQATTENMSEQ